MKKIILCLLCLFVFAGCASKKKEALNQATEKGNALLEKKQQPLNAKTKTDLEKIIKESEKADNEQEYQKYTNQIKKAMTSYSNSVRQLKQVTQPKQSFLVDRARKVKTITQVEAATEKTDGNNMMNKKGGYYAYIAMKSKLVKDDYIKHQGPVEAGNDGGAVIEAFRTVKDAKKRNDYLSLLDGTGPLSPGGHKLVGTLVIRTSNELTATQQKNLTNDIEEELIRL